MTTEEIERYAVTIIYSADVVIEVEADNISQAEALALVEASGGPLPVIPAGMQREMKPMNAKTIQAVTVAGREVHLKLTSWYAAPIREPKPARPDYQNEPEGAPNA